MPERVTSIGMVATLVLLAGILTAFSWNSDDKATDRDKEDVITNVHKAIVMEEQWLNVERPLQAEDLKNRIILLDFWTFCCINCMHVIPDLHYLEKKFGDKLTVIGVHSAKFANERDVDNIRNAILRYKIEHAVVNDKNFKIWNAFGVRAWPTMVLISPHGQISAVYSGEGNRKTMEEDIAALIEKHDNILQTDALPYQLEKASVKTQTLNFPGKLEYAADRDVLFISDSGHNRILGVSLDGRVQIEIGSGKQGNKDGSFKEAQFFSPQGLAYKDGKLYVADTNNHIMRLVDLNKQTVTTIAGTGVQGFERRARNDDALKTPMASPWDVVFYPDANHLAIAMAGTHQLWSMDLAKNQVSVLAGNGRESIDDGRYPLNSLSQPSGLSVHDGKLYFVDSETSSLRQFDGDKITTLIGTGLFDFGYEEGELGKGLMQHPLGLFANGTGVYIADSYNHAIRLYDYIGHQLHHYAATNESGLHDGALAATRFNEPNDITKVGPRFYVADTNNHAIRIIDGEQVMTLPIVLPENIAAYDFIDELPNAEKNAPVTVKAGASWQWHLQLSKGWKINNDAPTYIALFEMGGSTPTLVKQFTKEALQKNHVISLPALTPGKDYRLQGTLYYCEDKEGALCLIKGYDQSIKAATGGAEKLELAL